MTGGGGFIGSWLSNSLAAGGARVTILVREEEKSRALSGSNANPSVDIVRGNVEDADFVDGVFSNVPFDVIFHLASSNDNRGVVEPAVRVFDANILGTWNLLSGVRKFLSPRTVIVLASSAELSRLNAFPREPLADDTNLIYPYHVAKRCTEAISEMFFDQYGLKLASVRLPNVFGGGDQNISRIVPSIISALIKGSVPELTSRHHPARRYVYIEDVVDALLTVVDHLSSNRVENCRFGFSPRPALTTTALLEMITEQFYGERGTGSENQRSFSGSVAGSESSALLTLEGIGWEEKIGTRLGLERTIDWFRQVASAP